MTNRTITRLHPHLGQDETLLEGAYTFVDSRRRGTMGDGTRHLLVKAVVLPTDGRSTTRGEGHCGRPYRARSAARPVKRSRVIGAGTYG